MLTVLQYKRLEGGTTAETREVPEFSEVRAYSLSSVSSADLDRLPNIEDIQPMPAVIDRLSHPTRPAQTEFDRAADASIERNREALTELAKW